MNYYVKFEQEPSCCFNFVNGNCEPIDICETEPSLINGIITVDEKAIGTLKIYELNNDFSFYNKCDNFSDDCAMIAEKICGKRGNVLKKCLPLYSEYESIFILDRILINEGYRGKGIGSNIIKNLLYMLKHQFGSGCAIFLNACDFEAAEKFGCDSIEYSAGCKRLESFYLKAGYTKVKDSIYVYKAK